jgi:hypothetical protein
MRPQQPILTLNPTPITAAYGSRSHKTGMTPHGSLPVLHISIMREFQWLIS